MRTYILTDMLTTPPVHPHHHHITHYHPCVTPHHPPTTTPPSHCNCNICWYKNRWPFSGGLPRSVHSGSTPACSDVITWNGARCGSGIPAVLNEDETEILTLEVEKVFLQATFVSTVHVIHIYIYIYILTFFQWWVEVGKSKWRGVVGWRVKNVTVLDCTWLPSEECFVGILCVLVHTYINAQLSCHIIHSQGSSSWISFVLHPNKQTRTYFDTLAVW